MTSTAQNSTLSPTSPIRPQLRGARSTMCSPSMVRDSATPSRRRSQFYFVIHANVKNAHAATATIVATTQPTGTPSPDSPDRVTVTVERTERARAARMGGSDERLVWATALDSGIAAGHPGHYLRGTKPDHALAV